MNNNILEQLSRGLIVSCQALENEPLHSSEIMARMALAAKEGGAIGIRANGANDIKAIKAVVDLPVIGIVKRDYQDCEVYITPTIKEIKELLAVDVDVIALDATENTRPDGLTIEQLMKQIKEIAPNQLLMADCSTIEEVKLATELDFDIISTTLVGYTKQSAGMDLSDNDFQMMETVINLTHDANKYFIAEGKVDTKEKIERAISLGADSIVIGSKITRPQVITKSYVEIIENAKAKQC